MTQKKASFCALFTIIGLIAPTMATGGFLTAEKFPDTIHDVSFDAQIENKAAGYAPYADASPYMHIQLQSINDALADEVQRIEQEHEFYCMGAGANKPECMPYVPDATQGVTPQVQNNTSENTAGDTTASTAVNAANDTTAAQPPIATTDAYCAKTSPNIPRGQTMPLGVPVSSDLDIYNKAKRGLVCSGFAVARGGGHTHQGNDIGCNKKYFDTPIFATAEGIVSIVKPDHAQSTAGNYVVIKHADGFESWYMHLNKILVTQGQRIQAGCQIGTMGYTGGSLGLKKQGKKFRMNIDITHLHYELHNTNKAPIMNTPKGPINLKYGRDKAFDPIEMLKYNP